MPELIVLACQATASAVPWCDTLPAGKYLQEHGIHTVFTYPSLGSYRDRLDMG